MTAAAMTTATISDKVMLPSLSTILQEFAFQIETVVIRIRCTASGMDLHGSPAWTQEELESHRLAFCFVELRPVGDASPLSLHWGRRATYHIPIVLDYAAAKSPNQADQSDPENKRHCEREQGASPLFFIHVYICENWPKKGSRGSPLS